MNATRRGSNLPRLIKTKNTGTINKMKNKYSTVIKNSSVENPKAAVIKFVGTHWREICSGRPDDAFAITDSLNNDYNELTRERNTAIEDRERWHDMAHEMYLAITQGDQTRLQELAQIYEENMK